MGETPKTALHPGYSVHRTHEVYIIFGVADYAYGFAPLAPQFWGEQNYQIPPELGDLGGFSKTK
ncbi:hypothetical protein BJP34_05315 [Moorena producens PAL-8-15-08-1]|uniref:Uncharacterized protein n=2 Tax=Moorena TaxID=1155738 RepID=A0A1D8TNG2_9CYAN|nr:hypothetical protein BJP34_05315 [Moorena producens PAL-8-15-08-1]